MEAEEREALIEEGRNQVLYLMVCIGDENVAHDHWHPDKAHFLYETRKMIVGWFKHPKHNGVYNTVWPQLLPDGTRDWPDFEKYTYTPG